MGGELPVWERLRDKGRVKQEGRGLDIMLLLQTLLSGATSFPFEQNLSFLSVKWVGWTRLCAAHVQRSWFRLDVFSP